MDECTIEVVVALVDNTNIQRKGIKMDKVDIIRRLEQIQSEMRRSQGMANGAIGDSARGYAYSYGVLNECVRSQSINIEGVISALVIGEIS